MTLHEIERLKDELNLIPWKLGCHGSGPVWIVHKRRYPAGVYTKCKYFIYTSKIADKLKIPYIEWWRTKKEGEWGLSDDGLVEPVIKVDVFKAGRILYFPAGKNWVYQNRKTGNWFWQPWNAKETMDSKFWYLTPGTHKDKKRLSRPTVRAGLKELAYLWVKRAGHLTVEDSRHVCKLLWPKLNISMPRAYLKRFLQQHYEVRKELEKMILKAFKEAALTPAKAAEYIKKAEKLAVDKKDPGTLVKIAKMIIDIYEKDEPKSQNNDWKHDSDLDEFFETKQKALHEAGLQEMRVLPQASHTFIETEIVKDE